VSVKKINNSKYKGCSKSIGPLVGKNTITILTWMSETLIPFKVASLVMYTLLPAVLPLLETFLEIWFEYSVSEANQTSRIHKLME
jgi:hypothetical protein